MAKWRAKGEEAVAEYLEGHILKHKFSRCDSVPGKPTAVRHVNMCSGSELLQCGFWLPLPLPPRLHAMFTVRIFRASRTTTRSRP